MFFCVEMYLVSAQLKMFFNNPNLIRCDLLDFMPALWLISTHSSLAGKGIDTILIPMFLPSFPHGIQGNLPHYLLVWCLQKGDEIPRFLMGVLSVHVQTGGMALN